MDKPSNAQQRRSSGCVTTGPLSAKVHELYRRLGLCECAGAERKPLP